MLSQGTPMAFKRFKEMKLIDNSTSNMAIFIQHIGPSQSYIAIDYAELRHSSIIFVEHDCFVLKKLLLLLGLFSTIFELPNGSVNSIMAFVMANLCYGLKSIWS